MNTKTIHIFLSVLLSSIVLLLSGCFSEDLSPSGSLEVDGQGQSHSESSALPEITATLSTDASSRDQRSENKKIVGAPQPSQKITKNPTEIVRSAHFRDGLEPLYEAAVPQSLRLPRVSFESIDPQALMDILPGQFHKMDQQDHIFTNEEGVILGSNNEFSMNVRHPRCETELSTIQVQSAYSLAQRRTKTLSSSDELSFMSRAEAIDYSQKIFQSLGYRDLILRSIYSVYDVETGQSFYFIQWMQAIESVPVLDDSSLWLMEQDQAAVHCKLECVIDQDGLSYLRADAKLSLVELGEALPIIEKEEAIRLVKERTDLVLIPDIKRSVDSVELVWSSREHYLPSQAKVFSLEPFYLIVIREDSDNPDSDLYQMGSNFIQYYVNAFSGEIQ